MSIPNQLKELTELYQSGALNQQEFEAAKARVLAGGEAPSGTGASSVVTIQMTKPELKVEKARASLIVIVCFIIFFAVYAVPGMLRPVLRVLAFIGIAYGAFRYIRVRRRIWLEHE